MSSSSWVLCLFINPTKTHTAKHQLNHLISSFFLMPSLIPDHLFGLFPDQLCKGLKYKYSCTVAKLDKTMMMHSRAEKDTPRHGTFQNGTARVSTHDSTTDVCAGANKALQTGHSQVPALYQPSMHASRSLQIHPLCLLCAVPVSECVREGWVAELAGQSCLLHLSPALRQQD